MPVPAADAANFAGTYTQVGPFRTDLKLRPDGSYVASVQWGLLPSGDAVGNWRVTGKTLILTPFWQNELGREWFPHMNAMHIVRQGGDRFVFLRRCDVAAVQTEPDLPVYCFLLHLRSFRRTDQLNVPVNFVGPYYRGDGLGSNYDLVLKADGTYTVESYACVGKSGDASGTWHVSGKTLTLSPVKATGNMNNFAKTLDVVERDGRAVFVEPEIAPTLTSTAFAIHIGASAARIIRKIKRR